MIRILIITILTLLVFSHVALADDSGLAISGINIGGDTIYFPLSGELRFGVGTTLATYNEYIELRGSLVPSTGGNDNKVGIGVGVNIPALVNAMGGQWILKGIKSSVSVMGFVNLSGSEHKYEPAIVLNVIKIEF